MSKFLLVVCLVLAMPYAHASALPKPDPFPDAANDEDYGKKGSGKSANDEDYGDKSDKDKKKKKRTGKIRKIRPDVGGAIGIGIGIAVEVVDWLMDEENINPQKYKQQCQVKFGSDKNNLHDLGGYVSYITSRKTSGGRPYTGISSKSMDSLQKAQKDLLHEYNQRTRAFDWIRDRTVFIEAEFTQQNGDKGKMNLSAGAYVYCPGADPLPKPDEVPEPEPAPQPQPKPQPQPQPEPKPQPQPQPEPKPAPEPLPLPEPQPEIGFEPDEWEFELPEFCDWAEPVCDFIDWFRGDIPKPKDPTSPNNIDMIDDGRFNRYVSFNRTCPPDYHIKFSYMGRSFDISFSYLSFCQALENFAPFLVALTFLSTATMVVRSM